MSGSPLEGIRDGDFDALVLGGGLTGAAVARALAAGGARVCLVEPVDFGWAGSGRGARLALGPGGAAARAARVPDALERERMVLARAARHLVRVVPVVDARPAERGLGARIAGLVPRWLRRDGPATGWPEPRPISRRQLEMLLPGLAPGLAGAPSIRFDALLDERRLALAFALEARRCGARLASRCDIVGLEAAQKGHAWAELRDRVTGDSTTLRTRAVVNATGAFIDRTRRLFDVGTAASFPVARAARVVVTAPLAEAGLVFPHPRDGRPVVLAPVPGGALLSEHGAAEHGAAESGAGEPRDGRRTDAARRRDGARYLEEALASAFGGGAGARAGSGAGTHAGSGADDAEAGAGSIRVAFEGARVHRAAPGLVRETQSGVPFWSVASGVPLLARPAARRLFERLGADLGGFAGRVSRSPGFLPGGDIASLAGEEAAARASGLDPGQARWMVGRYGSRWRDVIDASGGIDPIGPRGSPLAGEIAWAVREEEARTLADLMHRWRVPEVAASAAEETAIMDAALARLSRQNGFTPARAERERARWLRERDLVYGAGGGTGSDDELES